MFETGWYNYKDTQYPTTTATCKSAKLNYHRGASASYNTALEETPLSDSQSCRRNFDGFQPMVVLLALSI
jgi:hypothetical protein